MKLKWKLIILIVGLFGLGLVFNIKPFIPLDNTVSIDKIVVTKHRRSLDLISNNKIIKSYEISLGRVPKGKKEFEGDKKTPEGLYIINDKNSNSDYYKNLGISYPNELDKKYADSIGKTPGGLIKIHGIKNGFGWIGRFHLLLDWTLGCIAMSDKEIDELFENVKIGTPIEIKP